MAIISIINYSSLGNNLRIEPEYYQPKYLEVERRLKKLETISLKKCSIKITDGTHFTPSYVKEGVKFYSALNVKNNKFDTDTSFKYISQKEHNILIKRCKPESEDILIRKVGVGPRWASVISKDYTEDFSIFVSLALIKIKKEIINPYYLSTFINSYYGQSQLLRVQKGMSQPDLHLEDIAILEVPRFNLKSEKEIEALVVKGIDLDNKSQSLYKQAQQLLDKELGLDKIVFEKPLSYEAKLSDVVSGNRIDAQCYKPDYINYEKYLREYCRFDQLGRLLYSISKGNQQMYSINGTIDYVSIKDIQGFELISDGSCDYKKDMQLAVKDDLLLAVTGATIGKVGIINRYDRLTFSGDLLCLKVNSNLIDPHYLLAVFQSPIIQSQCQRWITGSTNGHLAATDVKRIIIPRLSLKSEKEISLMIKKSLQAKKESEILLEQAKRRVEELIEVAIEK